MTSPLELSTARRADGATVLTVAGEIDMNNADEFSAALTSALRQSGEARLVVDLVAVEYLDSAGLAALFPYARRLEILANDLLTPVLDVSGLSKAAQVRDGASPADGG